MRSVVQRVTHAAVSVGGREVGRIGAGLLVFVGVAAGDGPADVAYTASKIRGARVFPDAGGRMNRSVTDVGGAVLVVSQFTLLGDVRKGLRPAFDAAEKPDVARDVYASLVRELRTGGLVVQTGEFQTHMAVSIENDGPVTILIDSRRLL